MLNYYDLASKYAAENGLDPALVLAIIHCESRGNPNEDNTIHCGLMQVDLDAANMAGINLTKERRSELLNPEINIKSGTVYYGKIKQNFIKVDDERLRLAAYRHGGGQINKYIRDKAMELKLRTVPIEKTPTAVKNFVETLNPTQREELIRAVLNIVVTTTKGSYRVGGYSDTVLARKKQYEGLLTAVKSE